MDSASLGAGDEATLVFENKKLDDGLAELLRRRKTQRARSHGNYLPALDAVIKQYAFPF